MEKIMKVKRQYPIGAEAIPNKGVHFRIWAPKHRKAKVVLERENLEPAIYTMEKERNQIFLF